MKFIIVGDPHLDSQTPSSRVDDYSKTTLDKLEQIYSIAQTNEADGVIILGDLFNRVQISQSYLNQVIRMFSKFKKVNIPVYTIYGNHDLVYNRLDTLDRTPIQSLVLAGLVTPLETIEVKGNCRCLIKGFQFPDVIDKATEKSMVCVAHRFYNNGFTEKDSISAELAEDLGYRVYILGHDHVDYDPIQTKNYFVIRPGSMTRGTADAYNLQKGVHVGLFEVDVTRDVPVFKYKSIDLSIAPAEQVFKNSVFNKDKTSHELLEILKAKVDVLLDKMAGSGDSISPYVVLDTLDLDEPVKNIVVESLRDGGIYREEANTSSN